MTCAATPDSTGRTWKRGSRRPCCRSASISTGYEGTTLSRSPTGTGSVRAIRDSLDRLLEGRLGPERDPDDLISRGRARYKAEQPPGYLDAKKGEPGCYGDLAIWLDVLDEAKEKKSGVILVTEERKEDWWWKRDGEMLGPPRSWWKR